MAKQCRIKNALFFLLIARMVIAGGNSARQLNYQLVESVPVETNMGIPETGRTLPVWLKMISGARKSIDIETFYFSNKAGEPLEQVVKALEAAAARGVKVRIISDGKFYKIYPATLDRLNRKSHLEVRILNFFDKIGGVLHAKYFVVDGKTVFLGSQNFDWRSFNHIHELGIRITQPRLAALILHIFDYDWNLAVKPVTAAPPAFTPVPDQLQITPRRPLKLFLKSSPVEIYPTFSPLKEIPRPLEKDEHAILNLINNARKEVLIQLLTYNPLSHHTYYDSIDTALRRAAARGVKVKLLVSDWNKRKPGVYYLQSLETLPNIEVKFSTIPPFSGGFIPFARVEHCKFMVVDSNLSWIGTANWAREYFYFSRNLGLVIKSREINSIIRKVFRKSWNGNYAYPVNPVKRYIPPRINRD